MSDEQQDEDPEEFIRQKILDTVEDLASQFLYYDRKEDDDLPQGRIEQAIRDEDITLDEIVQHFREQLAENCT